MMKALVFYWDPQHGPLAREALIAAGRRDLIGNGPNALIPFEGATDRLQRSVRPPPRGPRGPRRRN